jgi:hypothetical protein
MELEEKDGFRERPEKAERFFREGRSGQWKDVLTPATDQAHRRRSWRADGEPRLYAGVKSRNPRRPIAAGKHILTLIFAEKNAAGSWGRASRREPGLGTGRGGHTVWRLRGTSRSRNVPDNTLTNIPSGGGTRSTCSNGRTRCATTPSRSSVTCLCRRSMRCS